MNLLDKLEKVTLEAQLAGKPTELIFRRVMRRWHSSEELIQEFIRELRRRKP